MRSWPTCAWWLAYACLGLAKVTFGLRARTSQGALGGVIHAQAALESAPDLLLMTCFTPLWALSLPHSMGKWKPDHYHSHSLPPAPDEKLSLIRSSLLGHKDICLPR